MSRSDKTRFGRLGFDEEDRITAGYAHHRAPTWSRDGRLLAIAVGRGADASWVVVDRRGRVARTLDGPAAGSATFAVDGSLAFERRFGASSEIWMTPGGDAPPVRLLGADGRLYRDPAFSPDGGLLCCAATDEPDGRTQLILLTTSTGEQRALTEHPARADARPSFTSDDEVIFEGTHGDDHAIYALERLTPIGERARRPAAIDETLLVYERQPEQGPASLVLLDRARARAQVIVDDGAARADPACFVGKNGRVKIAFSYQPAPTDHAHGEAPRFDVVVAKLKGVTATAAEAEVETREAEAPEAPDAPAEATV